MAEDWSWQNVGVCGEPAGEDPSSARVAWFLEWTDRDGHCRRLLYGYGPGARCSAQAAADRIAKGGPGALCGRDSRFRDRKGNSGS